MKFRTLAVLLALLLGMGTYALPGRAEEEKAAKDKESKKEVKKEASDKDDSKVKVSNAFLNRWKNIKKVTHKRAYETQQTRTVAGVRASEAEDAAVGNLYFKGGEKYPSRLDLKNAISQLQEIIKSDPAAETVPEHMFFIADWPGHLGENDQALAVYKDLIKNHADTEWAKQAKERVKELSKEKK